VNPARRSHRRSAFVPARVGVRSLSALRLRFGSPSRRPRPPPVAATVSARIAVVALRLVARAQVGADHGIAGARRRRLCRTLPHAWPSNPKTQPEREWAWAESGA